MLITVPKGSLMLNALAHFERAKPQLGGDVEARAQALQQAELLGLPTRRVEAWHYTDLPRLLNRSASSSDALTVNDFSALKPHYLVFENGHLSADSAQLSAEFVSPDADLSADAMTLYNQALAENGLTLNLDKSPEAIVIVETKGSKTQHLMHRVRLSAGVKATVVDDHAALGYSNVIWQVELAADAELTLVHMQQSGQYVGHCTVDLATNAQFKQITLLTGGDVARHATDVNLQQSGAKADLHSAILGNAVSHNDVTYTINHQAADTHSHTTSHQALADSARGVFQGKVIVQRDAQRVDAQMQARAMMLSGEAEINAKPELEIYADDVVCAHGTAIGEIDADALFFLRARGIDEASARQLLIAGFVEQLLTHCEDSALADVLRHHIEQKISALTLTKLEAEHAV